jgi:predicted amidohydrolase
VYNPSGELIAMHRKLHLFDIDVRRVFLLCPRVIRPVLQIPGGITFKESTTLTGGDQVTMVETGVQRVRCAAVYDPEALAQTSARSVWAYATTCDFRRWSPLPPGEVRERS